MANFKSIVKILLCGLLAFTSLQIASLFSDGKVVHATANVDGPSQLITNLNAGLNQTLVVYGTSLTQYGRWADMADGHSGLIDWLKGLYGSQITMFNSGMAGKASATGLANLNTMVLAHNPDTVIIEFAINDPYTIYTSTDADYNISVAQSKTNLNAMIDTILTARPGTEIILQTMNPAIDISHYLSGTQRPNLDAYYQVYRDVAAERGLKLIDHNVNWTYLQSNHPSILQTDLPDGLHPIAPASLSVTLPAVKKALLGSEPTPSSPMGLTAAAGSGKVTLSWTAADGGIDYQILRSTASGGPYSIVASGITTTSYTDTGLTAGTPYYYIVNAVNGFGTGTDSVEVSGIPTAGGVIATPTGLTATAASSSQINLSWTASAGATSYTVKRATVSGGPYTTVATGVTGTSYSSVGLVSSTTYYYVVSAVGSGGTSLNSAQASAMTLAGPPLAPTGLTATAGNVQVALSWSATAGATSYNVKRATTSGGPYTTIASPTTNSYIDTGVVNRSTYYYVVSALNANGESANSAQASAKPSGPTNYYVSKNGNDSWDGTAADYDSGMTGPFLTIQKCASIAAPGDTCNIRAGTYRETVKPAQSGTAAARIVFQPYGNESVIVSGADEITSGWTPVSGKPDVYQTTVALNPALFANQVFVDGNMMTQARWPNTSGVLLYPTLAVAEEGTTTTGSVTETVYDDHLPNLDLTGMKVWMMGGAQFNAHSGTISESSPGSFTFNQPIAGCASLCSKPGSKYFIFGSLSLLDAPSEWHYDSGTQTLYLQTADQADPSTHASVEVKQRQYAFDLAARSYIDVKGIRMFASTVFTDSTSRYNVLDGINAQYPSHYIEIPENQGAHNLDTGIILDGTYNTLKNSTIAYSAGNGVAQIGRYNVITNNLIHDIDYSGTYNAPIRFMGGQVDVTATYNTIYNTGRDGMTAGGMRNRIAYNNVYNYGLLANDLGGYYTCCGSTLGTGTSIDHNWFHDDKSGGGVGIYIDNGASQFLIHHNLTWNNVVGIMLNGYSTGKSQGNKVYNNTIGGGTLKSIGSGGVTNSVDTVIRNNIFRGITEPIPGGSAWSNNLDASVDPLFVDASSGNHHLQDGSPAINAGAVIPGITDGFSGSAPDQGAYEFGQYDWFPGCNFNGYGSSCSPTNMLTNPGFEQGTTGWSAAGGSITTAADSHSGTSSLKVYNRTGASNSARQKLSIQNGKTYTFSAFTKLGSGTDSAYLMIEIVVGGQTYWRQLASNPVNSTIWTPLSRTYTFNEAGPITSAYLYVQTGTSLADLYVDDVFADVFRTRLAAPGMYVDKAKLNEALANAQTLYAEAVEGSEPGQYPLGSKSELWAAIQEAQSVSADAGATEDAVDSVNRNLNAEVSAFKSSRNLDPVVVVDINEMLADQAGWDADPGRLNFADGNLTFTPTASRTVAGYTGAKIPHNALLQFKTKLDTSAGLEAFGIRARNTNKAAWEGNNQYLIVVKSTVIEVQKWNGASLIVASIPNTFLPSGTWHTIQLGAVDTHGGVQVIMNVDGVNRVNWTDTNNPIQDEGYFEIYGSGGLMPIMLGPILPDITATVSPSQPY